MNDVEVSDIFGPTCTVLPLCLSGSVSAETGPCFCLKPDAATDNVSVDAVD